MEEYMTCPYCGADRKSEEDVKCPECKRIYPDKEERLMGFRLNDIEGFVDKNTERYIPIFKKNEGKKKFTGWNWASALVPAEWMFYRKMYKQGALYIAVTTAISIVLSILILLCFSGTMSKLEQATADYETLNNTISELQQSIPYSEQSSNEQYKAALNERSQAMNFITEAALTIMWVSTLASIAINIAGMVIMGLYGDCIYYHHVRLNATRIRDGGTSDIGMIGALIIAGIVSSLVETIIEFFIGIIF